jgi:hypothetical protein
MWDSSIELLGDLRYLEFTAQRMCRYGEKTVTKLFSSCLLPIPNEFIRQNIKIANLNANINSFLICLERSYWMKDG